MNRELTAIYFMWKREIIRFLRAKSRVVGSLGMPFFFLVILGTGLSEVSNMPGVHGSYIQFITPGILAMVLLFGSVFSGVIVIMDRQFGFLKETLVAPVSRTSIVLGKAIGGGTTAVIQGILMLLIAMLLGVTINVSGLLPALALMMVISVSFVLLGIAMASLMEDMHGFQIIMNFLIMPMFFLSGAVFPLDTAPEIVRYVSYVDPLTYAVEALRFLLVGYSTIDFAVSVSVLAAFFIVTTLAAAHLFGKIES